MTTQADLFAQRAGDGGWREGDRVRCADGRVLEVVEVDSVPRTPIVVWDLADGRSVRIPTRDPSPDAKWIAERYPRSSP